MILLADENIEYPVITFLRANGHAVEAIAEVMPGIADVQVLQHAMQRGAVLLTSDKDFGDLVYHHKQLSPAGIVLIRLPASFTTYNKAQLIFSVLQTYANQLMGNFLVISPAGVRITKLP